MDHHLAIAHVVFFDLRALTNAPQLHQRVARVRLVLGHGDVVLFRGRDHAELGQLRVADEIQADQIGAPLLGCVPLDARLRECGDEGTPLVIADPASSTAQTIVEIAEAIHAGRQTFKALPVLS